ncbi:peptidoglycan DD-metalloendopeptidase family protein [Erythrobacter sp. WH131]|uniref:Peptidoglycan DD-metalloendopeptidase family protein n=2 Tax=Erythrobacter ani TaxID=2827235 RepID=A0ABS6SKU2_9SPHN|nr:peptidoglycan DD-metalloendopeptidase family protein [Erythrobacter ani]
MSAAQRDVGIMDPGEAQAQLERATRESQRAQARSARLARQADAASEAAEKTAREAASIAAQIQRAEAEIAATRARFSLARTDRAAIAARLAERQQPLARLTGALQTAARRPLALSALQPGSLKELVYVRAVLDSAVPQIRARTAALRGDLDQVKRLEQSAADALEALGQNEQTLQSRREELAELETRQRLASRQARGTASRQAERALALAEEARDLDGLMSRIDDAASLRAELASLPGPVMRPASLGNGRAAIASSTPDPAPSASPTTATAPPQDFQLPVQGRTLAGFGALRESGLRSTGLSLGPVPGAQIVAPASGRVVFAGPYRGYGRIVIIEHAGGWTSLVTGLERTTVEVGDSVIGGSPLGSASRQDPSITLELRREGEPVNPLQFLG